MVEFEHDGVSLAAIDARVLQEVLEDPLLVGLDYDALAAARLGLVVVDIGLVVAPSIGGST